MGDFCFLNEGTKNRYFPTAPLIPIGNSAVA